MTYYETKTISYKEGEVGEYSIMITKLKPKGNRPLNRVGFRSQAYIFTRLDGRISDCTYDVFEFTSDFTKPDDDHLYNLLSEVERGEMWERIEDGKTYTPEEIDYLLGD